MTRQLPTDRRLPALGPLLLCYDGSNHAGQAILRARTLLRPKPAVVVYVGHGAATRGGAESGRRLAVEAGFTTEAIVEAAHRPTAAAILDEARNRGASVIVIASHGHSPKQPTLLGDAASTLVGRSDIPVLVIPPTDLPAAASEPIFACYDGSGIAGQALVTAARLLAGRATIVASFVPAVDDTALLNVNLPWPAGGEMEDRLARIDRQEAEVPVRRADAGTRIAEAAGLTARAVAIAGVDASSEEEENPWRRLLRAAVSEDAACLVVAHRPSVAHLESTAYGLIRHCDRPVLVVPGENGA